MTRRARRPPRPGGGSVITLCSFLLLCLSAAQQQLAEDDSAVPGTRSSSSLQHLARESTTPLEGSLPKIDSGLTYRKKTNTIDTNENAVATLAPARINQAVRAPPVSLREPAGLSSLLQARSLQDWEVEDFVLLATLDGSVHSIDRESGIPRWLLSYNGAPMVAPMVETIHHWQDDRNQSHDGSTPEIDYMFVVEPSKDGALYLQSKDPAIGLQRLGITVKSLTEESPQSFDDPPLVYTGGRTTAMFVVDADTGEIIKKFGDGGPDLDEPNCKPSGAFDSTDGEECVSRREFQLGRIYYNVKVQHRDTKKDICTIKFSEWAPNNRDIDLQSQYIETKDKRHIYSLHDGRYIGVDYSKNPFGQRKFTKVLSSPVARVFDIVRYAQGQSSSVSLALLSQPVTPPQVLGESRDFGYYNDRTSRVFVNRTETGDWYAFSELTYPMVTSQAEWAKIFRTDIPTLDGEVLDMEEEEDLVDAYTGIQSVSQPQDIYTLPTLPGPIIKSALDTPVDRDVYPPSNSTTDLRIQRWPDLFSMLIFFSALLSIAGFISNFTDSKGLIKSALGYIQKKHQMETSLKTPPTVSNAPPQEVSGELDLKTLETGFVHVEAQDVVPDPVVQVQPPAPEPEPPIPPAPSTDSFTLVDGNTLDAAEQPLPEDEDSGDEDGDLNENGERLSKEKSNDKPGSGERRRTTKRGKRGGKKHKRGKKPDQIGPDGQPEAGQTNGDAHHEAMAAEEFVPDVPQTPISIERQVQKDLWQVGSIMVNTSKENELGQGSNGTVVYRGEHHGRQVAVKRLMRSANSLAAREIRLLLRSDDNDNVIRYFGQETSAHFTWIALELFTASLDQVVEYPERYPEMIPREGINTIDCLRQITRGVEHLHGLKLVHRDLKPQNILVKARENLRLNGRTPQLRYVISDFGLCKQLDENNPNSAFAPTANHTAAGTTGWRAPELLVDSRSLSATPASEKDASIGSIGSVEGSNIDPTSGRRVTKAIDIFSLGCIFFYVMTHGKHPYDFGGEHLGRDLNIKLDKKDLGYLRMFDYSFEAEDLILQMLNHNPTHRILTFDILKHPYFWSPDTKIQFLCELSDYFEHEKLRPEGSPDLDALQSLAIDVIPKNDFLLALPKKFKDSLGKQRSYTGSRMLDLLRALRNKKNHFNDLDPEIKEQIEALPGGYWQFWSEKFPSLLICCHCMVIERDMIGKVNGLGKYF